MSIVNGSREPIDEAAVAAVVDRAIQEHGRAPEATIPILQAVQTELRWIPEAALRRIVAETDIRAADLVGVATFYSQFRLKPAGRHIVKICHGTACHVKGSPLVEDSLRRKLGLVGENDTDKDGEFTLEGVACLGCCTLAPVVQIDGTTYGHLTPDSAPTVLDDFLKHPPPALRIMNGGFTSRPGAELRIAIDSCCAAGGADQVHQALLDASQRYKGRVAVKTVACTGLCHQIPFVEAVDAKGGKTVYSNVAPEDAESLVLRHAPNGGLLGLFKASWSKTLDKVLEPSEVPAMERYETDVRDPAICRFVGPQLRIATEHSGVGDPLSLAEYIQNEGMVALRQALSLSPEAIIDIIEASGLRGRGGAGFPTGRKWRTVSRTHADAKYLVVNADEGDPGAFMDRMLLESFPYRVLEGVVIAAIAVGAEDVFLYVRAEYPYAVRRVTEAIAKMEAQGYLGEDILGSGKAVRIKIKQGAGAFVCGEETALIASLEGRRGVPSPKPPFPAEKGLWGKPTSVNNVETFSLVPWILRKGPQAFAGIGTSLCPGTKVFSLAGNVVRGGLIEVPMGTTIRQIVEEIGGGVAEGRQFKAVQIGGPSGGCIPASLADTPVDFEDLQAAGAIMGSGGLVVLDDTACMVDVARYFLNFTQKESCGLCTSCRIGTRRMLEMLDAFCTGKARHGDVEHLESLAEHITIGSLCGLGISAPNPVLTTIRYFREEYEAHIKGVCPAGKCVDLITYEVTNRCIGCTKCAQICPVEAIPMAPFRKHEIDDSICVRCDECRKACPENAIVVTSPRRTAK